MATVGTHLHRSLNVTSTMKVTGAVSGYEAAERHRSSVSMTLSRFSNHRYLRRLGERLIQSGWLWPEVPETGDWTIDLWNDW